VPQQIRQVVTAAAQRPGIEAIIRVWTRSLARLTRKIICRRPLDANKNRARILTEKRPGIAGNF
jgi:hypothetical protein